MKFIRKHLEILKPQSFTDWAILAIIAVLIIHGFFSLTIIHAIFN